VQFATGQDIQADAPIGAFIVVNLVAFGASAFLAQRMGAELVEGQERYEITIAADPGRAAELLASSLPTGSLRPEGAERGKLPSGEWVEIDESSMRIGSTDPRVLAPVIDALRRGGVLIRSLQPRRPSLEDLFMQAVTDPQTGEELLPGAARKGKKATRAGAGKGAA